MRKPYLPLFVLLGAIVSLIPPAAVLADEIAEDLFQIQNMKKLYSRASKLRTADVLDQDTVWIGHIHDPLWIPKRSDNSNVPGVPAGGYGPFHVGRGPNLQGGHNGGVDVAGANYNGTWTFDHYQAGEDSLQGWWPVARGMQSGDFADTEDRRRTFFGLDFGNQGNYVINMGANAGTPKRTFGVTGYWHRDPGNLTPGLPDTGTVIPGPDVEWAPLGGSNSAWCGLRGPGDLSVKDESSLGGTGNYFNADIMTYNGENAFTQFGSSQSNGTDKLYPGYGSQWDQMLYRDVAVAEGSGLTISFKYRTNMSKVAGGNATQRIGYFYKDPLRPVVRTPLEANNGNFISATEAAATGTQPVDSFMVYIGIPVNESAALRSDGTTEPVYDLKRRWLSEVVKINNTGSESFYEIFSASGVNATATVPIVIGAGDSRLQAIKDDDGAGGGGTVRLVFRVKTNRGGDDEDYGIARAFNSGTAGAAIIDDVVVNGWAAANGDFEAAGSINNDTAVPATSAWKSTGKPPPVYGHIHNLTGVSALPWNDPCSQPTITDPSAGFRTCNMLGNALSLGDHDNSEKPNGLFGGNFQDNEKVLVSPTINLKSNGPGDYNAMGIDAEIADATGAFQFWFDQHTAGFRGNTNGQFRKFGATAYPGRQLNGALDWTQPRLPVGNGFFTANSCVTSAGDLRAPGFLLNVNANGIPDSIRIYFQLMSRCFTFAGHISDATCGPTTGANVGSYVDNLSFAIIDAPPPPAIQHDPWTWLMDAFPARKNIAIFTGEAFDTSAALIKATNNVSLLTGANRPSVPADTGVIKAAGNNMRIDMVFRILPGPGNYTSIGNRLTQLRKVPTNPAAASANATSRNFWEAYLGDNGAFGTGGNGTTGPGHGGNIWDPNRWNSARCDTAERNLFPATNISANLGQLDASSWMTTYHESDPKYAKVGYGKRRCFVVDEGLGKSVACGPLNGISCNVICGAQFELSSDTTSGAPGTFPPAWLSAVGSGFDTGEDDLPEGWTYEYSKIIPDGQLTPGSHVQYLYRRAPGAQNEPYVLSPDTNFIFHPTTIDAQRWFHASILPDRWKDPAYGGLGLQCMLVVDLHERSGDEGYWVSLADSIGLTLGPKRGAHNGWKARGDEDITVDVGSSPTSTIARRDNGGQPGSAWDLWNTKAGESQTTASAWISNRGGFIPGSGELTFNKDNRTGPEGATLRAFYRTIVYLAGSLVSNYYGAVPNRTDDDFAQVNDFALAANAGTPPPRGLYVIGRGFAENLASVGAAGTTHLSTFWGATLRSPDYRNFAGNSHPVAELVRFHDENGSLSPFRDSSGTNLVNGYGIPGLRIGIASFCGSENDVFLPAPIIGIPSFEYENMGSGGLGPYIAGIYAPDRSSAPVRDHRTLIDGHRIQRVNTYAGTDNGGDRMGFLSYFREVIGVMFADLNNCGPQGAPLGIGDNPGVSGSAFVNFLRLKSENPMRSGTARISFGVARTEKVEIKVYDVSGRQVKTVANRVFPAGIEHVVTWDGTNDAGHKVARGVYFYQMKSASFVSQKKLALLQN